MNKEHATLKENLGQHDGIFFSPPLKLVWILRQAKGILFEGFRIWMCVHLLRNLCHPTTQKEATTAQRTHYTAYMHLWTTPTGWSAGKAKQKQDAIGWISGELDANLQWCVDEEAASGFDALL